MPQSSRNPSPVAALSPMSYQVLARKWRPQDFASLVGQEAIVQALRNAIAEGRIAQAYLFSGIRGVGKTTAARVFAKALNCEHGPAADPCNACTPCREITSGADLDVLEVDAATYSKVEQVRDLTASLRYGPTRDRYKVVVLDEVHRLSAAAFDALLKIVEEPPPRLVFIFATTEAESVPATILSRCQEYHFRRVGPGLLADHLAAICTAEGIVASPAALRLIARAGEGSVRDSVALLDQLATFGGGQVDDSEASRLLGGLDTGLWDRLLGAILDGDGGVVSSTVRGLEDQGTDPRHAFAHFLAFCRDALHLAQGADPAAVDLPEAEAQALAARARATGSQNLLRLLHLLIQSEPIVRRSEVAGLALEIVWLRAAELPHLLAVETLLAGGAAPGNAAPPLARPAATAAATPPVRPRVTPPAPARTEPAQRATPEPGPPVEPEPTRLPPVSSPRPQSPTPSAALAPAAGQPSPALAELLEAVSRRRASLAAQLAEAVGLELGDGELVVLVRAGDPVLAKALEREANAQALTAALVELYGPQARFRLRTVAEAAQPATPGAEPPGSATSDPGAVAAAAAHPTVQAVLDIFGGTVTTIDALAAAADELAEDP